MKYTGIAAVCLLLLVLLPVSCIKDDYAAKEKATVQVTFTTRAEANTTVAGSSLADNERMKTLRVIVAKGNDILYNVYYKDFDEDLVTGVRSKTITFSELTVSTEGEKFDFYAIANEEGVGYNESWNDVTIAGLEGMKLQNEFLTKANTSKETYIPQTAYQQITVKPQSGGGIQSKIMQLNFAVAKVRLTINNTSVGDQYVKGINLSGLNMVSTPLFAGTDLSDVTNGVLALGNMTIHAGESATVYAYFFENIGGDYALTAYWNSKLQTLDIKNSDANITEISRGTELDINITLNATTTPTFNIEVVPWTAVEVDVPPFN